MNVKEITDLFWDLADEKDRTFQTDARTQSYLGLAYNQRNRVVAEVNPYMLATSVDIAVSGTEYNLGDTANAVTLLGQTLKPPGTGRLHKLLEVGLVSAGEVYAWLDGVQSHQALRRSRLGTWTLIAGILKFDASITATVRLVYVPESTVDWTKTGALDDEFVDDLTFTHELIALYALRIYRMRDTKDGRLKPGEAERLQELEDELRLYAMRGAAQATRQWVGTE